jgi:WD40 repeat protein
VDRLSAPREHKTLSKAGAAGTIKTGFTCMLSVSDNDQDTTNIKTQKNVLICGHSSGGIFVWRRQRFVGGGNNGEDKGPEAILPSSAHDQLRDVRHMHKGPVTALKIQPNTLFLYSGGSDRLIKLWDIFHPESAPCLRQSFSGHGGSITAIEFAPLMGSHPGYMFTGSTDQSIIVWHNAQGYMYVCMYVCMYVYAHVCMYVYTYICMYVCV